MNGSRRSSSPSIVNFNTQGCKSFRKNGYPEPIVSRIINRPLFLYLLIALVSVLSSIKVEFVILSSNLSLSSDLKS